MILFFILVFNYWEPTHFITNGFGLQTWEYSPDYAIRSWFYIFIHSYIITIIKDLIMDNNKLIFFYGLRLWFALLSSFSEFTLYETICDTISKSIGNWFLIFMIVSPGMFHASVSYLPSSFAMYMGMLGLSYFIRYISYHVDKEERDNENKNTIANESARTNGQANENENDNEQENELEIEIEDNTNPNNYAIYGIVSFAIGGLIGWPFALAIALPFLLYTVYTKFPYPKQLAYIILGSGAIIGLLLGIQITIDSTMYKKFVIVPLNIILYNVFPKDSTITGPEIFGIEPWYYYFQNLIINFNLISILSYFSILLPIINLSSFLKFTKFNSSQLFLILSPLFLWSLIFIPQPHKEERFFYVIYPSLCLNASLTIVFIESLLSKFLPKFIKNLAIYLIVAIIQLLSLSRIIALCYYYGGAMEIYQFINENLSKENDGGLKYDNNGQSWNIEGGNICLGREWYRYSSSYFIPDNMRLKFIKSGFDGLLPGEFSEELAQEDIIIDNDNQTLLQKYLSFLDIPGTYKIPPNMNNKNQFDESKLVPIEECSYIIDQGVKFNEEVGEVNLFGNNKYTPIYCTAFISGESKGIGRTFFLPKKLDGITGSEVSFVAYCLVKVNNQSVSL